MWKRRTRLTQRLVCSLCGTLCMDHVWVCVWFYVHVVFFRQQIWWTIKCIVCCFLQVQIYNLDKRPNREAGRCAISIFRDQRVARNIKRHWRAAAELTCMHTRILENIFFVHNHANCFAVKMLFYIIHYADFRAPKIFENNTHQTQTKTHTRHTILHVVQSRSLEQQHKKRNQRPHSPFGRLLDLALIGARNRVASLVARLPRTRTPFH